MQFLTQRLDRTACRLLLLAAALIGPACQRNDSAGTHDSPMTFARLSQERPVRAPTLQRTVVRAGAHLVVDCGPQREEGDTAQDLSAPQVGRAALYPEAPVVGVDGTSVTFAPTQAGFYVTQCVSERDGSYAVGATLEVLPADAETVTVVLGQHAARAGEAIEAACQGTDAFGNLVPLPADTSLAGPVVQFIVAGTQVVPDAGQHISLDARLKGEVDVRCVVPAWSQVPVSESVVLQVSAPPVTALSANVEGMFFGAHEPVAVRCMGTDAWGHERWVENAVLQVVGGDVTINGQSFLADTKGRYQVVCMMPQDGTQAPTTGTPAMLTSAVTEVNIAPGPPARWDIRWHDTGACLSQSTPLPFTWHLYDAYGNVLDFYDVALTTEPPTLVGRNLSGGYTIYAQGRYTVKIVPVGPGTQHLPEWHKEIVVNSTPPEIVITSPKRAAMVQGDSGSVMLTGYVKSALGPLLNVTINGETLADARGREMFDFSVPAESRWGLNIVRGRAQDICGNEAILTQSFLYSDRFSPVATDDNDAARVAHAVRARFGQATWDDGDASTLQDVATLMQMALQSSSLEDRLPHRLGAYPARTDTGELPEGRRGFSKPFRGKINGIEVFRDGPLAFHKPTLEYLHTNDGGWDVAFALEDLVVPFKVEQYAHWGLLGSGVLFTAPGKLTTRRMSVEARIKVSMQDGQPRATVSEDNLRVIFAEGAPELNLALPFDNYLGGRIESLMLRLFRDLPDNLVPIIEDRVRREMTKQMDIFLAGLQLHSTLR